MGSNPIINGAITVLQPGEFSYSPRAGWRQTISWRGNLASCNSLATALAASGYNVRNQNLGGGVGEISYEVNSLQGNSEVPQDAWQLPGTVMQKSIYEHPNSIALDLAYPGILAAIQTGVANGSQKTDGTIELVWPAGANQSALTDARTRSILNLVTRGTDHFDYTRYAVRHTQTISQLYTGNINDTNAENLYSTSQLISECQSFPIPIYARYVTKINLIAATSTAAYPAPYGYMWAWKKSPTSEANAAGDKIEATTEFEYDLWSTYLYAQVGTGAPEV